MSEKIYVIDEPTDPEVGSPGPAPPPPPSRASRYREGSPVVLFLAYVAGPLGLLATSAGWASHRWRAASCLTALAWVVGLATVHRVPEWIAWHPAVSLAWPLVTMLVATSGSVTWARGVMWAQEEVRLTAPRRLRHPLTGGLLGFLLPGLAHTVVDQPRRAVAILALTGPLAASVLVARHGPNLWRANHANPSAWIAGRELEVLLVVFGVLAAAAVLFWLLQALDGVHAAALSRGSGRSWTEGLATALVALVVVAIATTHARAATELDAAAFRFRRVGCELVPLWLWRSAAMLDGSEPGYALRAATQFRVIGDGAAAARIERDLARRWERYRREVDALAGRHAPAGVRHVAEASDPPDDVSAPDPDASRLRHPAPLR